MRSVGHLVIEGPSLGLVVIFQFLDFRIISRDSVAVSEFRVPRNCETFSSTSLHDERWQRGSKDTYIQRREK
jgi:hypothetical protein